MQRSVCVSTCISTPRALELKPVVPRTPWTLGEPLRLVPRAGQPRHGYAIAKDVKEELTDGRVQFSAATLYENLSRMLDSGLVERDRDVEVEPGERRKTYRMTGEGAGVLSEYVRLFDRARGRVRKLAAGVS